MRRKYIRLFVSSTFSDMTLERNLLKNQVFPCIKEFCLGHGWDFDAIDLRWGIPQEASLDQRTMRICIDELHRCQQLSPQPNFLILLGNRYGWCPLPERISLEDYDKIDFFADLEQQALLKRWYRLDTNAIPPEYVLQPRTNSEEGNYQDNWMFEHKVYKPLRKLFLL